MKNIIKVESSSAALKCVSDKLVGRIIKIPDIFSKQNVIFENTCVIRPNFEPDCRKCMEGLGFMYAWKEDAWFGEVANGLDQLILNSKNSFEKCRQTLNKPSIINIETEETVFSFAFLTGCFVICENYKDEVYPYIYVINDHFSNGGMPRVITMTGNDPASPCMWCGPSLEDFWDRSGLCEPLPLQRIRMRKDGMGQTTRSILQLLFEIPEGMKPVGRTAERFYHREIEITFDMGYYNEKIHPILWIDETPKTPDPKTTRYFVDSKDMKPLLIEEYCNQQSEKK